jgi:hypothetical protein
MTSFEKKTLPDGSVNPKYVDLCDEDPPLAGQKFVCVSFISPEKILKQRELYLFQQFVKQWEFTRSMSKFTDFLQFMSHKHGLNIESVLKDFNEFTEEEKEVLKTQSSIFEDDYATFIDKMGDHFNDKFHKENGFQTSVRGIKIRGSFPTQEEAEMRCKKIRADFDPNHDIFVAPVGIWVPWHPDAYKTGKVEFMEEELNQLHAEKIKNDEKAKQEFEQRKMDARKKALEENVRLAQKSGNKLTQTMDDNGNLVGVRDTVNFDEREAAEQDTKDLMQKQLEEAREREQDKR